MSTHWLNLAVVIGLTLIHIFSKYITFNRISLTQFTSLSAGVGISYVFLHLLPAVSKAETTLQNEYNVQNTLILYFLPLLSFSFFYVLDHLAYIDWESREISNSQAAETRVFWAHMVFFVIYNAVIGYYLTTGVSQSLRLLIIFIAFGLHFITNDWGLRHHHENVYDKYGRLILSFSILFGYLFGRITSFPTIIIELSEAFILGGMLLNVFKLELPSEKNERIPGFLLGVVISAILFSLV